MGHFVRGICAAVVALGATSTSVAEDVVFTLEDDQLWEVVKDRISPESFASLSAHHKRTVARIIGEDIHGAGDMSFCFSDPVPSDVNDVFNQAMFGGNKFEEITFNWTTTATDGGGIQQGDAITITYSFVPDGTTIPANPGTGSPAAASDLFAFFDGIYGSTAAWQAEFAQMFSEWSALTGITYVFEPSDDGGAFPESGVSSGLPGVVGVRGDVRIGGYFIDGESGSNVLAFNFFPTSGDMVIDTANPTFYGNLASDSLRLRNTASHEHGHGLGMFHVCPIDGSKIMEPTIFLGFDGPQLDDVLNGQKWYGDPNAGNDSTGTATDLGTLTDETVNETLVSLFGNSEEDFYEFTIASTHDVDVTLTPTGTTYLSGPQVGMCDTGSAFNTLTFMNLDVELLDTDGSTVLDTGASTAAGVAETASSTALPPGTYFVRVFTADANDDVQAYSLSVDAVLAAGPQISNPSGGGFHEINEGSVVLSFDVAGTVDPTTYSWSKNGSPLSDGGNLSGTDTPTLTISPISGTDSGAYRLTVTDSSVKLVSVSDPIVLTVVAELPVAGLLALGLMGGALAAAGAVAIRRRRK